MVTWQQLRVVVNSRFEAGSFAIPFEVWQDLSQLAASLLGAHGVKTAKDILEWLDLLKPGGIVASLGARVLGYYQVRAGRTETQVEEITSADGSENIQVKFAGDLNNVTINRNVYYLGNDHGLRSQLKRCWSHWIHPE